MNRRDLLKTAAAIAAGASVPAAGAVAKPAVLCRVWTGAVSNDWSDPRNWAGNQVPKSGEYFAVAMGAAEKGNYRAISLPFEAHTTCVHEFRINGVYDLVLTGFVS